MGVRDRLASLGRSLGEFNQVDFGSSYSSIAGVNPADGYCAGVCLDWTRRVLQSRADRDESFLNYSKNAFRSDRQTQALRRMATAFSGQGASYVTTTRRTDLLAKLRALGTAAEARYNINGVTVTGVPIPIETAELIMGFWQIEAGVFNLQQRPAGVVPRDRVQRWLTLLEARADPQRSRLADGGREWGQYAGELDQQFSADKTKTFANLFVVTSSNQQTYASEGVWRRALMTNGLQAGRCTIVGLGAPGATGHAVAVHEVGGDYRFFDPNYGVYEMSSESLGNAFQHLFWTPFFNNDEGLDPDLPVYRRRTSQAAARDNAPWTRMSYTIFGA